MSLLGNLQRIKFPVVYDAKKTGLHGFVDHRVSFVLPFSLIEGDDAPETTIVTGVIKSINFTAGDEVKNPKSVTKLKSIYFESKPYEVPDELQAAHKRGEYAATSAAKSKVQFIGTLTALPRVLQVTDYEIQLDQNLPWPSEKQNVFPDFVAKRFELINSYGSRSLTVGDQITNNEPATVNIPQDWILQNLTAIDEIKEDGGFVPVVYMPAAFPSLGTRISHAGKSLKGEIIDFKITPDKKIAIKCKTYPQGGDTFECLYSKIFSQTKEEMLHPEIAKVLSVPDRLKMKKDYLSHARELILESMSRWKQVVFPKVTNFKMLCMTPTDDDPEKLRNVWLSAQKSLDEFHAGKDLRFTSLVECAYQDENETVYSSCVSNAVNGDVFLAVKATMQPVFFSTENHRGLSIVSDPLFKPHETTETATIDLCNPTKRMLGYAKLNPKPQTGPNQIKRKFIVMWTEVSEQFYNLYRWIVTQSTDTMFVGKTKQEMHDLFWDPEQPELVEIYEFVSHGITPAMTSSKEYPWVNWFVREILMMQMSELIDL